MGANEVETLMRVMLAAWAGDPMPDVNGPEFEEFERALAALARAQPRDMMLLGIASAKALLTYRRCGLEAQRAAALAQIAGRGGMQ